MKLRHLAVALVVGALSVVLVTAALGAKKPAPPKDQTFFGTLLGKNEVSATGKKRAGDPDGRGGATAVIEDKQFCFGIVVKNIDQPIQAHVHRGGPGVNGDVVIKLFDPPSLPASGDPGAWSGCVEVKPGLLAAIKRNPHKYYFNVHTDLFPSGAIRGQIFSKRN